MDVVETEITEENTCPFCHNSDDSLFPSLETVRTMAGWRVYYVLCNNCYARGPSVRSEKREHDESSAAAAWEAWCRR